MFTIRYKLQDGGPLYNCAYPQEDHLDYNIFFIRGTNDQGKTTALNMVALGLHANENFSTEKGIITDSLRAKMDYLTSGDLDHLEFDFNIRSIDGKTSIHSHYDDNGLLTELNNELVGPEYFNENVQVLYDIPDDPLVKLQSSVRLIKDNLVDYEKYLERYSSQLEQKITQIMDFKVKDKKIKDNQKALKDTERDLEIKREIKSAVEKELQELDTVEHVFTFFNTLNLIKNCEEELKKLRKKKKDLKDKGVNGGTSTFKSQVREFNTVVDFIKSDISKVKMYSKVVPTETNIFINKVEKNLSELYTPRNLDTKTILKWTDELKEIISQLEKDPIHEQFKDEETQYELVTKMMEVLRGYLSFDMNIPGTNVNGIFSFYKELEKFREQVEPKIEKKRDISKVLEELHKLAVLLSDLKTKRELIPELNEKETEDFNQIEKSINKLNGESQKYAEIISKHEKIVKSLSDSEIESILKNPSRREKYLGTKKEFEDLKKDIEVLELKVRTLTALIEQLGILEAPPEYNENWLQEESEKCEKLISKIIKWKQALEPFNLRKENLGIKYTQEKEFFDALSEYFAEILRNVYFEKISWEVERVDLVNRQYIVRNRKPIKFIQMGTGHTALNSILSRIKQNFGGKKKIILVDEIGHMDEKNIGILVEEIKNQVKCGETILALITIADSTVSEITWEPVTL